MTEQIESNEYRVFYRFVIIFLLINNLLGISLNIGPFILSLVFFVGIPGLALIIHYLVASFRKNPVMLFLPHLLAIVYNFFIYKILFEEGSSSEIIGNNIWPQINILFSVIALIISSIHFYKMYK
jgi:hypothetical protein